MLRLVKNVPRDNFPAQHTPFYLQNNHHQVLRKPIHLCCWEKVSSEDLPLQKGCPNHFLHIRLITSPSGKKTTKECVCLSLSPSNSFRLCLTSKHKSVLCSAPHVSSVFWPWVLQTVVWGHRVYAVMVHLSHIVRLLPVSLWQMKAYVSVWLQTPGAPDTGR